MGLLRLEVTDFRNLNDIKIIPSLEGFNFIYGDNGSGKTSLLEAIYYLSLGRSFRSLLSRRIVNDAAEKFSLFAEVRASSGQMIPVGIERAQQGDILIRIAGDDVHSITHLANLTPVQLIHSNTFHLLDTPFLRRKYLDWGVFYQNLHFLSAWKGYMRALKQRNAALRGNLSKQEVEPWSQELILYAGKVHSMRHHYIEELIQVLYPFLKILLPNVTLNLEMIYQQGWSTHEDFEKVLRQSWARDQLLGYTQYGPHRSDLKIVINKVPVKDILSRGQQKLFVCAMIMAQGSLLQTQTNKNLIYLVDDLPSELDERSRENLMGLFSQQRAQVFITAVERGTLEKFLMQPSTKMFHVEHGRINEF